MTDDLTTAGPLGEAGARLRALVAFLRHKPNCAVGFDSGEWRDGDRGICNCGLAAELDALLSASVVSGWQPIATAPKDCELLLYGEYASGALGLVQGAWNHGGAMHMPHWMGGIIRPTHWMPLPAAPVVTQEGE
jgi:hypothetical protein